MDKALKKLAYSLLICSCGCFGVIWAVSPCAARRAGHRPVGRRHHVRTAIESETCFCFDFNHTDHGTNWSTSEPSPEPGRLRDSGRLSASDLVTGKCPA
eukprot:6186555-Pleurochrysis_carterae.AAC.1